MLKSIIVLMITLVLLLPPNAAAQSIDRYLQLGDSLYYSNPDSSYTLCLCAEKEAVKKKDESKRALSRLCKVRYLILKSRYKEASSDLAAAVAYFREAGDKNSLARAYNSKAILLERLGDDQGKYNYQNEAVRLYEETGNVEGQVKMLSNLSLSYTYDKRFKEAAECLDRILLMIDKLKQTDIYFYYQNRGILYMHKGDFEKAAFNLDFARRLAKENQMIDSEITALTRLAEANIQLKKYALAQEELNEAMALSETNRLDFEKDEVYTALITLFTAQEKYRQAFEALTLQNALREKTDRLQSIHQINEQDKKDDLNAKLKASQLGQHSKGLDEEVETLRFCCKVLTIASIVFLLVLAWALFRIYKLKKKNREQRETLERLYRNN